jgi:hypothetical protein
MLNISTGVLQYLYGIAALFVHDVTSIKFILIILNILMIQIAPRG